MQAYTAREHAAISASQLTGCLRGAYLKYTTEYYDKPGGLLPLMMGTFTHSLLECAITDNDRVEVPVAWTTKDLVTVTGHVDHVDIKNRVLSDWKTTRWLKIANLPYGNHEAQVNIYRYLLANNEIGDSFEAEHLQIVYIDLTGPAKHGEHNGVVVCPVKIWPEVKVKSYIEERARILAMAYANNEVPPMVRPSDAWLCGYCPVRPTCDEIGV
jgi:hypothetical protein